LNLSFNQTQQYFKNYFKVSGACDGVADCVNGQDKNLCDILMIKMKPILKLPPPAIVQFDTYGIQVVTRLVF
jgi:hypothetical protein